VKKEPGVPASPIRRRVTGAVLGSVALVLLASGCATHQQDAKNYADTEDNFLEGCENIATSDTDKLAAGQGDAKDPQEISDPKAYCQCVFDALSGKDGVPFDEFKEINSRMRDEGGPLPDSFIEAYDGCKPSGSS